MMASRRWSAQSVRRVSVGLVLAVWGLLTLWGTHAQRPNPIPDGALRGYLAVRVTETGAIEIVDALNADRLFVPASVLKVVTAAATLDHLGTDYRWTTRLTTRGRVSDGVLDGDLVLEAGADPTWGADLGDGPINPIPALARGVLASGMTHIRGDLILDTGHFPGRRHPTGRTYGDLPYGLPLLAIGIALLVPLFKSRSSEAITND